MTRRHRPLRRFLRDARAVAAVEFALIFPLLLLLYFGTVEAASLYTVDRRVATVSSTMADLVSRERGCISNATLNSYFAAAAAIMRPSDTTGMQQVVSLLKVASNGTVTVQWSKPYPTTGTTTTLSTTTLPPKVNELARGKGWLVAAEISYPYTPVYGLVLNDITLAHTQFFLPRYEQEIKFQQAAC